MDKVRRRHPRVNRAVLPQKHQNRCNFGIRTLDTGVCCSSGRNCADTVGAAVKRVPDVLECHLMAGTADYLLKDVAQTHSSFALRTVFKTTALPV
jgi:hypothetical protein